MASMIRRQFSGSAWSALVFHHWRRSNEAHPKHCALLSCHLMIIRQRLWNRLCSMPGGRHTARQFHVFFLPHSHNQEGEVEPHNCGKMSFENVHLLAISWCSTSCRISLFFCCPSGHFFPHLALSIFRLKLLVGSFSCLLRNHKCAIAIKQSV